MVLSGAVKLALSSELRVKAFEIGEEVFYFLNIQRRLLGENLWKKKN